MASFHLLGGEMHAEAVPLASIAAAVGTPAYVYSADALRRSAQRFRAALGKVPRKQLMFAVKANPSLAVLRVLADQNYGADIVSGGELDSALRAGIHANHIVFSGVGKTASELIAALDAGIGRFNIELEREGQMLSALAAQRGKRAPSLLRINPDIDASTHVKITTGRSNSKFGIPLTEAGPMYDRLAKLPGLDLHGLAVHIGSQINDLAPLEAAYRKVGDLVHALRQRGHRVYHVDLGGGLGVAYKPDDRGADVEAYGAMVADISRDWDVTLLFEPGRFIAAQVGVLLTRVLWIKPGEIHPFVVVDAAMNDLARPALYDAWHEFAAVHPSGEHFIANIVGPICESGDTFATARTIDRVCEGDLALFLSAGAYGAAMASTYNCRPLVPEVLVEGNRYAVVAQRIAAQDIRRQRLPPWMAADPQRGCAA
jgi:diaminopimelate decarboxylase